MKMSVKLRQAQTLSPQILQTMEILQMGTIELREYLEKTVLENPVLELSEEKQAIEPSELARKLEWLSGNDRQNRQYHREDAASIAEITAAAEDESLYKHLREQLPMERFPPSLRRAVDCVLTGLNDDGYLEESPEELAARCNQSVAVVKKAEGIVRELEPPGIAARSLSDCLAIQLKRMGETGLALQIAQDFLEDVAHEHYNHIAVKTGASRKEIQDACRLIRSLDPKPGAPFGQHDAPDYIVPDLLVTESGEQLIVTVSDGILPSLEISPYYRKLLRDSGDTEVQNYLTEKLRQADWIVQGIEQRKNTLLHCARCIVNRQARFFRQGPENLIPMTQIEIADTLGVHESTVSRAVRDKYLQCRFGLFPLSHFFSRALPAGGDISAEQAKSALRDLIEGEDKKHPLSDQKLCDSLAKQGIELARRTVAKYREELGIPSTAGRRHF